MDAGLEHGIRLFNSKEFFECHEVLEDVWREEQNPRKLFLQAIIHFAVAFHHHGRGNMRGARGQLRKALTKLMPYLPVYEEVDTKRLFDEGRRCLLALEYGTDIGVLPRIHVASGS